MISIISNGRVPSEFAMMGYCTSAGSCKSVILVPVRLIEINF
jgi:hypothetical protein